MSLKLERDYIALSFFLLLFLAFTVAFFSVRGFLHGPRMHEGRLAYEMIYMLAVLYAILVMAISFIFGFFYCRLYAKRHYLSYQYNVGCFIIFFTSWGIWIISGMSTWHDSPRNFIVALIGWGTGIAFHTLWVLAERKNNIKGIQKDEIFD